MKVAKVAEEEPVLTAAVAETPSFAACLSCYYDHHGYDYCSHDGGGDCAHSAERNCYVGVDSLTHLAGSLDDSSVEVVHKA